MKSELRTKLFAKSTTAVLLSLTCFFGCSSKKDTSNTVDNVVTIQEPTLVNADNVSEITSEKDKTGANPNTYLFRYKTNAETLKSIIKDCTEVKDAKLFDAFSIYKANDADKYVVVNKDEAVELLKSENTYSIVQNVDDQIVMTTESGQRVLVFGSTDALKKFSDELKQDFDEATAKGEKPTIVNGLSVSGEIATQEITRFDGTRTYYDFEELMKACIAGIEKGGYADPISYEKAEDNTGYVVTRMAYYSYAGELTNAGEVKLQIPTGEKGEVYWDQSINCLVGMTFEEDGKTWICDDVVSQLLGIDITDGTYTIPGTDESYEALIIDTSGSDEVKVTVQPSIEVKEDEVTVQPNTEDSEYNLNIDSISANGEPVYNSVELDEETSDDPIYEEDETASGEIEHSVESGYYDKEAYEKLGVEVHLSGTNEEQAAQYVAACKEKYPSLPWEETGMSAGISNIALQEASGIDVWSMSQEENDEIINERLAGRDYHDLSLEELADVVAVCGPSFFSAEIVNYFNNLTGRDFTAGGWYIRE